MELALLYISMSVLAIYLIAALVIFMAFYVPSGKIHHNKNLKFISIVIPFRNEEKNLPALIESLQQLNYSKENFEIVFVNDHSTDKGVELIQQSDLQNFTLVDSIGEGKKEAIVAGITEAKGELIACTDADCKAPPNWLDEINKAGSSDMILGPVQFQPVGKFLHLFQEIEFAALQSISAATCFLRMSLMSNGANMAYKKDQFNESALKKQTASGDDIFLLEDFKKRKLNISYLWNANSIVKTAPVNTFNELIQQKVRWASKSKYYKNYLNTILGFLILVMNLVVIYNYINFASFTSTQSISMMIVVGKAIADLIFILPYLILIKKPTLVFLLPAFVLLYPFYFIYVFLLSLTGKFTWKDRDYRA